MYGQQRTIRNPITGEELIYSKGPLEAKPQSEVRKKPTPAVTYTQSENSIKANASSIPLLNFNELDDDSNRFKYINRKLDQIQTEIKLNELRNQNPIVAPAVNIISARPKSSYRQGFQNESSLNSPILAYQKQIDNITTQASNKVDSAPVSQLKAPRFALNLELTDSEEIKALPKPATEKKNSIYKVERVADLEKLWIEGANMTGRLELKADNDSKHLKEKLVVDTVITDQLSRFDLSQNQFKTVYTPRGNKFSLINNHSKPPNSLSENQLAKRVKFNCRVKSPDGKLALRELFGILFLYDGSMTIYEFKLLCGAYFTGMGSGNVSKKANALPFLQRKAYTHAKGRRKDQTINAFDIFKGAVLYLGEFEIEVTDVDEVDKENQLTSSELQDSRLSGDEMSRNVGLIKERLCNPLTDVEVNDIKIINSVKIFMRKQIERRSVEVYIGLSKSLKKRATSNGLVSQDDFHNSLIEYNVQIHSEDLKIVWQVIDLDSTGQISYYSAMRAYFGEMNCTRHAAFRTLLHKLDTQKTGFVQINEIYKYYKANLHPKVRNGDLSENEMFEQYLSSFDLLEPSQTTNFFHFSTTTDTKSKLIAYEQLEQYYNGLSIVVDSDIDFFKILKNSWNLN